MGKKKKKTVHQRNRLRVGKSHEETANVFAGEKPDILGGGGRKKNDGNALRKRGQTVERVATRNPGTMQEKWRAES